MHSGTIAGLLHFLSNAVVPHLQDDCFHGSRQVSFLVGMVQNPKLVDPFVNQVSDTAWVGRQEGFESVLQLIW